MRGVFASNAYRLDGDVAYIDVGTPRHPNAEAIIDVADLPLVIDGRGKWGAEQGRSGVIYAKRSRDTRMHRRILGLPPGHYPTVDHRNHDGLDNRRLNFRLTDHGTNRANGRRNSKDKPYKGVFLMKKSGRYRAMIQTDGKLRHLGCFATEEDAAVAYNQAAMLRFGDAAMLNLIEDGRE